MHVAAVNQIVLYSYLFLLVVGLTLPSSGSHSILHPKSLGSFLLVGTIATYFIFFKRTLTKLQFQVIYGVLVFLSFTVFWLIIGCLNENIEAVFPFDQFKLYLITAIIPIASLLLKEENILSFSTFLKTLLYANSLYVLVKIGAVAALILRLISFDKLTDLLGIRAMGMAIFGDFQRFQTSMDIATPFLIFFCLESSSFATGLPRWFRILFPFFALVSTVISFSRVLIFIALLGILFHFCLHSFKYFLLGVLLFLMACVCGTWVIGPENAWKMVEVRLFSRENQESDDVRNQQIEALMEENHNYPLFGMGLGGYSEREIRDKEIKHSYEVQWVALLAQLGYLGILFLILPLIFLTLQFFYPPLEPLRLAVLTLWLGWVAAGFTNPFVISLTSGIMYSLFILASFRDQRTIKT